MNLHQVLHELQIVIVHHPRHPTPGSVQEFYDWRIRYQLSNLRRLHEGAVVISSPQRALRERLTTNPDYARPDTSFCHGLDDAPLRDSDRLSVADAVLPPR